MAKGFFQGLVGLSIGLVFGENIKYIIILCFLLFGFRSIKMFVAFLALKKEQKIKHIDYSQYMYDNVKDFGLEVILIFMLFSIDVVVLHDLHYLYLADIIGGYFCMNMIYITFQYYLIVSKEKEKFIFIYKVAVSNLNKIAEKYQLNLEGVLDTDKALKKFDNEEKNIEKN